MSFYTFCQNNSGGSFVVNSKVSEYVIIEADNAEAAASKALSIGIYFDGVEDGIDCSCCGDRWDHPYNGTETPMIYVDAFVEKYSFIDESQPNCYIHYADNSIKPVFFKRR